MGFLVIAERPDSFAAWLARQRDTALTPTTALAQRGQEVFLSSTCVMCHAIGGTPAGSRIGPDLTHLASRRTIAAGTLPNTRGNLAGWILNPQSIKPGTRMPATQLESADLQALLAYLETLK
jgi:cytochrome c oxidase subunit 2